MNDSDEPRPAAIEGQKRELALLVIRCQLGERDALDRMVVDWHASVFRYVASFLQDPREVDEVCQNVWLGVLRGLPRLKERASFAPWLFGIARRSAFDWMRMRYRHAPEEPWPEDIEVTEASDGSTDDPEGLDPNVLEQGLQSLTPLEREVVLLHYFEGLPIDQIGEAIHAPPGTVKSRLHRARRKLRAQFGPFDRGIAP
ncbi:ECF RNA polymerase sigma factor SigW [Planctomycetes bacterium Poly30]|uniref:ECF RNA polymerase sigma factor SigW n=1 Tax=Saltatorellus ferox TaxID=2528018 RepID=A0A518ERR0_9BACT|nr:ECF RNA polymerase sigma factor SigW [Planctomycetes bacterium Poly30]